MTKINGLSPTYLTPKGSLPLSHHGRGHPCGLRCFFQKSLSNTPLRSFTPRQLQTSTKDVFVPPLNVLTPTILPYKG